MMPKKMITSIPMDHQYITLAHGNGGRLMRELIEEIFARQLDNPRLDTHADAASLAPIDRRAVSLTGARPPPLATVPGEPTASS